jgi:O-antigen ligase
MLTPGAAIDRDRLKLMLAVICAVPCGIAVGLRPAAMLLATAVGLGVIACMLLPMRHLPALLVAVMIVMPSLVFEGIAGSGQARAVVAILVLALGRVVMARSRITVPGILPLAIGAALVLTLIAALVAASRPARQVGNTSDLVRDLSYPAAAVIGFVGGAYARVHRPSLAIPRAFACLGLVAALGSIWYWAWRALGVAPLSHGLFSQVSASSAYGARSVFPFVEDSPNSGAVMFVLLGAFAAPPLMLASAARDRLLGLVLVVASLAAVLTTQSRTGLLAAGFGALAYLVLVKRGGGRRSTVLVVLILLAGVGAYVFGTFPAERASGDTLAARIQIWGQAGRAFLQDPILGHGYGYSIAGNFVEASHGGSVSRYQSTHSDILSELVDGGVVGAAIFVAVLGLMFVVARRALADDAARPLGIGYSCMLTVVVVGGLDTTLSQSAAAWTLEWLTFGVMVGVSPRAVGRLRGPHLKRAPVGRRRGSDDGRGVFRRLRVKVNTCVE